MNTKFKFGLTLAATLVLAACGSSGGKGKDNSTTTVTPTPVPVVTPAPVEETSLLLKDDAIVYGGKFVKKKDSNLNVGTAGKNAASGKPTPMTVKLEKHLDTIVIAAEVLPNGEPKPGTDLIYLEDFDFRGNSAGNNTGIHTFPHIHVVTKAEADASRNGNGLGATGDKDGNPLLAVSLGRTSYVPADQESVTKTHHKGQGSGIALVFDSRKTGGAAGHYVNRSDVEGAETVAEVYGHRTFVDGDVDKGTDAGGAPGVSGKGDMPFENAPYLTDNGAEAGVLKNVQYGRVTSSVHKLDRDQLRYGVDVDPLIKTRIASYGGYGNKYTENSYFYRGVNPTAEVMEATGQDLIAKLKQSHGGKIRYVGHAVTYGFDAPATVKGELPKAAVTPGPTRIVGVPNAIMGRVPATTATGPTAPEYTLYSGTHVDALVDLDTYLVSGSLTNVYLQNGVAFADATLDNVRRDTIAEFTGNLTSHGNVRGLSKNLQKNEAGSFSATLYGVQAPELGGAISSDRTDEQSWGAVFGAKQSLDTGLGVGTDSENKNK